MKHICSIALGVLVVCVLLPPGAGADSPLVIPDSPGAISGEQLPSDPGTTTSLARGPKHWRSQTVDSEGSSPTLQVDARDVSHVAYYHSGTATLRYATLVRGRWQNEIVGASERPRTGQFLAVDGAGVPHVVYERPGGDLVYATRRQNGWDAEFIAHTAGYFGEVAVVLDRGGNPFVFYVQGDRLSWTNRTAGGWSPPEELDVYFPDLYSIAIDDDDDLFMTTDDDADLKYGARRKGLWEFPPPPSRYGFLIVAVDRHGEPAIAISLSQGLCVGREQAGGWQLDVVDPAGGDPATLSFDHADRTHLLYHRGSGLGYARGQHGGWAIEPVTPVAGSAYMDLGPGNVPRIVFEQAGVQYALANGDPSSLASSVEPDASLEGGGPATLTLSAWPLPCRGALDLSFVIPQAKDGVTRASLGLFDVNGRKIREIASGMLSAGVHSAHWDGRDDNGGPAPTGIYFLRLSAGSTARQLKVVRIP